MSSGGRVIRMREKPDYERGWINGGFYVLRPSALDYITCPVRWEHAPLEALAAAGQLAAYEHVGIWQCLDTWKDKNLLEGDPGERTSTMEDVGRVRWLARPSERGGALHRLRGALGPDRILEGPPAMHEIQSRSLNQRTMCAWILLRPQKTEECRIAVEALGSIDCDPQPIAALTTFWEPYAGDYGGRHRHARIGTPARIDIRGKESAYFGAGLTGARG